MTYIDAGIKKAYLSKMPREMVSAKSGNASFVDATTKNRPFSQKGGWIYYTDTANVHINVVEPLDKKWGEYESEKPIDW